MLAINHDENKLCRLAKFPMFGKVFVLPCLFPKLFFAMRSKNLSIDTCRVWASPIMLVQQSRAGFWTLGTLGIGASNVPEITKQSLQKS